MGSVPQNRPATALLAKGSTGNPRTKAAAESAVRPAKEARRKSARQANRSPPRGSASPEIHTPKQRQRTFCFVESPENAPVRAADSALRSRSGAARPAEELRRGRTCRASRSLSCGSVSPGSRALGAGGTRAAGVDNSTLRRIVGGTSEQRVQRFEAGQARFVQRKSLAGEERAEPAGACPAAAFRREAARWALGGPALRGWTILRSVESSGVRPSSGFSASKSVRRGSSSGRASPGKDVTSQPELVPR